MKKTGGFTLIEVLIVAAIIGVIAAIAIPSLLKAREMSKQKQIPPPPEMASSGRFVIEAQANDADARFVVVCDKQTGNLLYLVSYRAGFETRAAGLAVVKDGCQP